MRQSLLPLAAAVILVSCSGGGGGGGGGAPPPPPPPPTTGAIKLLNQTSYSIHEVYIALSSASSWGGNRTSSAIPPSYSLTVSGLPPNYWDIMAVRVGADSPYFAYGWDLPVVAGEMLEVSALNSHFSGSLKMTNGNATYSLTGLYVVPTSYGTWGNNQLPSALPSYYYYVLWDIPPGYYDVMCVHSNGGSSTGTYLIASQSLTSVTCY